MTSGTDELRRLLDERGVEWSGCEDAFAHETYWKYREHGPYRASERVDISGELLVHHLTPEQAIAATLGAGTCKRVMDSIDPFTMWVCDHCGHPLDTSENFCGGCGRRIEQ